MSKKENIIILLNKKIKHTYHYIYEIFMYVSILIENEAYIINQLQYIYKYTYYELSGFYLL